MVGFALDGGQHPPVHGKGRQQEFPRRLGMPDAGQQIEHVGRVLPEIRPAGQQAHVGVKAGGGEIVIARAQMDVAAQAVLLLAHHQANLGVDFVAHHAMHHVDAGLFQAAAPLDVVGFIEARAQLHHRRDFLAPAGRFHQRADNPRVAAGAVERLFDGQHARAARRGLQKLRHAVETLIRMVQEDVPPPNSGEEAAFSTQGRAGGRAVGRVAQRGGMMVLVNAHQARRVQRAVNQIQVVLVQPQRAQQRLADGFGAIVIGLQPHRLALAPVVQFLLNRLEQIPAVLLVNIQLAVAGHAKMPVTKDVGARKQIPQKMPHDLPQKNIIPAPVRPRQRDHRRQHARRLHHRQMPQRFRSRLHFQLHDDVERFVQQLRKRMVRVNGQRRQHGTHFAAIKILQPCQVRPAQLRRPEKTDAVPRQGRRQFLAPADILLLHHAPDALMGRAQCFGRGQAVVGGGVDPAFDLLFQAGHAHLEELVQVGTGDAEKLEPFEHGIGRIARLLQHALIKLQPAQFPIKKSRRLNRCRWINGRHDFGGGMCAVCKTAIIGARAREASSNSPCTHPAKTRPPTTKSTTSALPGSPSSASLPEPRTCLASAPAMVMSMIALVLK